MSGTLPEYTGLVRWTINDVIQWLSTNGFSEFCRSFREARIDGVKFVELDETELNRMRTPMNKRSKLIAIIKSIRKPDGSGVQNIINNRAPASPHVPQRDYRQKAPPPSSAPHIDSDESGSGTDDDYEWAPSDFEDEDGHGHGSHNSHGHTGHAQEDSESDSDYENTKEHKLPPVPGRDAPKEKFSVDSLRTALSDFKKNSVRVQTGYQNYQDDPEENYDEPDRKPAPPQPSRPERAAHPVPSQPALPSRPGRKAQPAPPPEEEQPTYEETGDPEPPLPSRPGRRAPQPVPQVEKPPPPVGRRAQPVPPPQDDQSTYEETDISDLATEEVYDDPDNPTTSSQPPPPPRQGKRVIPPPQNTRRPPALPVNEPEEYYEDPNDLPEAPKPPIDDQPTYEVMEEESNQKHKPPARPPGKGTPGKSLALPPRGPPRNLPHSDSDTEDYEKPNEPTAPIPNRFGQKKQRGARIPEPSPTEDLPGYMDMQSNDSQNPIEDDIYVVPDEEDDKRTSRAAPPIEDRSSRNLPKAPPPVSRANRDLPKTPGSAPQFRLPERQPEPPPVTKSNKREPKKEPAVEKAPSRSLPPPPRGTNIPTKGTSRPLPTVPPVNDQEDLNSYDWYRGNMTRNDGDAKLKQNRQNGMFAIRDSSKKSADGDPRPYTLMIFNDGKVYNLPIRKRKSDGHYAMGNPKPKEETFPKLADLVAFFSKRMIVLAGSGQTHLKMPIP